MILMGAGFPVDSGGNLWLFGSVGFDPLGTMGSQNHLWEYSPVSNEWTWVDGCGPVLCNKAGVYGTKGMESATNLPGGRVAAVSWIDIRGNFWLFGGQGYDSNGRNYYLNDLLEYAPTTKQWTWVSGSDLVLATADSFPVVATLPIDGSTPVGTFGSLEVLDAAPTRRRAR